MGQWSGDDWQAYCDELLIARCGADYQRIPDELGDYGAEGVTSDGCAVQAYAAEEVVDSKKLYEVPQLVALDAEWKESGRHALTVSSDLGELASVEVVVRPPAA